MNKEKIPSDKEMPKDSFNANYTAIPKETTPADKASEDPDVVDNNIEYGKMNVRDAKESGYINEKGKAVSKAKRHAHDSPTGAYTDIGEGRSSVVRHRDKDQQH
jgi:hypothetical protein